MIREIKAIAKQASKKAYCPYSKFPVGAAVLTKEGKVFSGCNVENASFGLTICAERNAIFGAIAQGHKDIIAVVIFTQTEKPAAPCGACRQVISEFNPRAEIYSFCISEDFLHYNLRDLLPNSFTSDFL
ncbi:MAG: cytidine deaminase [Sedimentisphaerales bacterium]|nr:cytidine deaminase [Sedimentisphaerales bacterium]